jgi:hypothetical protein
MFDIIKVNTKGNSLYLKLNKNTNQYFRYLFLKYKILLIE